ncbi:THAP domain-containing protein 5-like [Platichthys flesus]|uniref:THAP domain-containing protein 5-like n=1 Tax=Platichthys flesus TaxID=8260 RepID=UPI002DBF05E2|nr:THAP domain-containing protein 5-like [Platichthys flesus]
MPKYCSVPSCKTESCIGTRSFYRFPLQEPERLQQWLRNMGRENWAPSRHQYICHQHFAASCFRVRWGIRYLESDAVPTLFHQVEKRKAEDQSEERTKRVRLHGDEDVPGTDGRTAAVDAVEVENSLRTVHLYEITVDPAQCGGTGLVESSHGVKSLHADLSSLTSGDGFQTGTSFPLTLTVEDSRGDTEVVVMSDGLGAEGQDELVKGIAAAILTQGHDSTLEAAASLRAGDVTEDTISLHGGQEVIAVFETIPSVLPPARLVFSPNTVLSSALSSKPISSTVPIVSKHAPAPPTSLVLTLERLDTDEGDDGKSDEDDTEQQDHQLEEHCYHRSSLSKEQLEAIVSELQKKVKVLQQRHRRHLEKLLGLENTVTQLRQSNLLNEERLQLLERAYEQTSAAVMDAGETVAIVFEEDTAALLYTPLEDAEDEL